MTSSDPDASRTTPTADLTFDDLQIHPAVLRAVADVGYESPSAIQAATIPAMMAGSDVVGLAQTGTGKTAAFAIPILSKIDTNSRKLAIHDAGDGRHRRKFEELDIIQFEHLVDTTEEYGTLDAVAADSRR